MGLLSPDLYYTSVGAIDLGSLTRKGVRAALVDLDNTLLPRDTNVVPGEARAWAERLAQSGIRVCLISNNWHARVKAVADALGFCLVDKALKPLPYGFRKAMRVLGVTPDEAVVIGDQVFTDILGGNLLGVTTVLVRPLSATDLPHTLLLRRLEALVLRGREPLD